MKWSAGGRNNKTDPLTRYNKGYKKRVETMQKPAEDFGKRGDYETNLCGAGNAPNLENIRESDVLAARLS